MNILDLPNEMLLKIFGYLSYEDVFTNRLVCQRFDQIRRTILSSACRRLINDINVTISRTKSLRGNRRRSCWYEDMSTNRLVCQRFDQIKRTILSSACRKLINEIPVTIRRMKALRRNRPLNCCYEPHVINFTIYMLYDMQNVNFMECCFNNAALMDKAFQNLRLLSGNIGKQKGREILRKIVFITCQSPPEERSLDSVVHEI